jgi:protein SCO1/2
MASRRWLRPLLWALLLAALLGVGASAVYQRLTQAARAAERERAAALPELGRVPPFTLVNRDGRTVRRENLAGAPWIADFIFTRCVSSCPMLTARLARLDRALAGGPGVRLVSFSVDPEHDTPPVLEAYARSFGASRRWLFLTGDPARIRELSRRGFKLALEPGGGGAGSGGSGGNRGVGAGSAGSEAILHSTRFVLVDGEGAIRGTYQALDPAALRRLAGDARALAGGG